MESKSFQFLVDKLYPFNSRINNYVNDVNTMFNDLLSDQNFNREQNQMNLNIILHFLEKILH